MCKFSHLLINEPCTITMLNGTCMQCASPVSIISCKAIYGGHIHDGYDLSDVFYPTDDIRCPECNTKIDDIRERCGNQDVNIENKVLEEIENGK